jgi:hypothetical protein
MATISGDTQALPPGWYVDLDNWGTRIALPNDADLLKLAPRHVLLRSCIEGGMLCVHTAAAARYFDNLD